VDHQDAAACHDHGAEKTDKKGFESHFFKRAEDCVQSYSCQPQQNQKLPHRVECLYAFCAKIALGVQSCQNEVTEQKPGKSFGYIHARSLALLAFHDGVGVPYSDKESHGDHEAIADEFDGGGRFSCQIGKYESCSHDLGRGVDGRARENTEIHIGYRQHLGNFRIQNDGHKAPESDGADGVAGFFFFGFYERGRDSDG
jgi:hypothetical protein